MIEFRRAEPIQPTDETILAVRTALANAQWDLNLPAFCRLLGIDEDYYAEDLFEALGVAVRGMSRFDEDNFVKLVRAGRQQEATP